MFEIAFHLIAAYLMLGLALSTAAVWLVNVHDKAESPITFSQWLYMIFRWPEIVWKVLVAIDDSDG